MSGDRVGNIPELVELILLSMLPNGKDILIVQSVNKCWRNVITRPGRLRRALFLEGPVNSPVPHRVTVHGTHTINMADYRNPYLQTVTQLLKTPTRATSIAQRLPAMWRSPTASWRSMILTNRPFEFRIKFHATSASRHQRLPDSTQCTMGQIVAWADHWAATHSSEETWIEITIKLDFRAFV